MHEEYYEISEEVAGKVNKARKRRPGALLQSEPPHCAHWNHLWISPGWFRRARETQAYSLRRGYTFKAGDVLLTKFHLPQSTWVMLVSAFLGLDKMKAAYTHAIEKNTGFTPMATQAFSCDSVIRITGEHHKDKMISARWRVSHAATRCSTRTSRVRIAKARAADWPWVWLI